MAVTIIVIIILSSVAILTLQNTGIIYFAQNSKTEYYKNTEKEKTVLDNLSDLINEKVPEDKEEQGTTQKSEEFLKTKLLEHNGDAAIDEYGEIMDVSLWNIITDSDGNCATAPIPDPDDDKQMNIEKFSPSYKGNIVNGEFEHNIPAFVKIGGNIYKLTSIGSYSFNNCDTLITVTIPFTVNSIVDNAFIGCSNLEKIIVPKMSLIALNSMPDKCNPNALVTEDGVNGKTLQEICDEFWDNWWDINTI